MPDDISGERASAAPSDEQTATDKPAAAPDEAAGDHGAGDEAGGAATRAASGERSRPAGGQPAAGDMPADSQVALAGKVPAARDHSEPDPLTDLEQRRHEAGVEAGFPFGRPGRPLGRAHPFVFGFVGAFGVFTAWMLIQAALNVRQVLMLIVVSMFLAVGLNPAVERLKRLGLPRGVAVAVVFGIVLLCFVGLGIMIVSPLTAQVTDFAENLPGYIEQLQHNPRINDLLVRYQVQQRVTETLNNPQFGQQVGERVFGGLVGVGKVVATGLFGVLTVLILTLYFLASLPSIKTFAYRLAPRSRRARVALLGDEILERIGGYVAGIVTVAFIAGVVAYVFLLIIGMPYALTLAIIVSFTAFIPLVGATIGAVIVTIVAFFHSTPAAIACGIFFIAYQWVENFVIHPRVMKRAVDVQPAVTVIAALVGGALLGVVGALLAIPTAAAIALILREVLMPRQEAH